MNESIAAQNYDVSPNKRGAGVVMEGLRDLETNVDDTLSLVAELENVISPILSELHEKQEKADFTTRDAIGPVSNNSSLFNRITEMNIKLNRLHGGIRELIGRVEV